MNERLDDPRREMVRETEGQMEMAASKKRHFDSMFDQSGRAG
jgi:hypothetical protein